MKSKWIWIIIGIGVLAAMGTGVTGVSVIGISPIVKRLAEAIANAEGFNVPGSRPNRNHNPGDITQDITQTAVGRDTDGTMIYATDDDGWNALYRQIELMFSGSGIYNVSMTIAEIAQHYAEDWQPWARNVAAYLGVSENTRLDQLV